MKLTSNIVETVKKAGKIIISGGNTDDKSGDKSSDKSGDKKSGTTK